MVPIMVPKIVMVVKSELWIMMSQIVNDKLQLFVHNVDFVEFLVSISEL